MEIDLTLKIKGLDPITLNMAQARKVYKELGTIFNNNNNNIYTRNPMSMPIAGAETSSITDFDKG